KTLPASRYICHYRGTRPNVPETSDLEKLNLHEEKSATVEMQDQMHLRCVSQKNLTHIKKNPS
ncbi:hypothetical protein B296_00043697, partial [Ensete ventricosum]